MRGREIQENVESDRRGALRGEREEGDGKKERGGRKFFVDIMLHCVPFDDAFTFSVSYTQFLNHKCCPIAHNQFSDVSNKAKKMRRETERKRMKKKEGTKKRGEKKRR